MRFIVTCSTSCSFLLKTLVISFHSLYLPLQSFSIFTSLSVVLNPCWLFLRVSSRSRWPRPPLSPLPVSPYSPPNPFLCLFDTHTLCPSILLSAHPPIYFHHTFHPPSYRSIPLCFHGRSSLLSTLPYSLPHSISPASVTLHLPVFVSLSFQEFIWRKCCFPNSIAPHLLSADLLTTHIQLSNAYTVHAAC